ncbi:hypothetical protein Emag_000887 [Eimeria magna]
MQQERGGAGGKGDTNRGRGKGDKAMNVCSKPTSTAAATAAARAAATGTTAPPLLGPGAREEQQQQQQRSGNSVELAAAEIELVISSLRKLRPNVRLAAGSPSAAQRDVEVQQQQQQHQQQQLQQLQQQQQQECQASVASFLDFLLCCGVSREKERTPGVSATWKGLVTPPDLKP